MAGTRPPRGVYRPVVQRDLTPRLSKNVKGTITPKVVVLHTTESHDHEGLADIDGVAGYLADRTEYGIHLIVDKDGNSGAYLVGNHVAPVKFWHAGNVNGVAFGIEMIGKAGTLRAGWWLRPKQLVKVARWLAYFHAQFGIPLEHSTTHGVCRHVDVSGAGGHWDPGPGFPYAFVLKLARTYNRFGWTSAGPLVAKR